MTTTSLTKPPPRETARPYPTVRVPPSASPCVASEQLFAGGNELLIDHHGALYRLRRTSLGKLILTK